MSRRPWHTDKERQAIERRGGEWSGSGEPGIDGEINGRPVEVRSARRDDRYRIQKDVHEELVAEDGFYIFTDDERGSVEVPADELTDDLTGDQWFADRRYPHRFAKVDDVFGGGGMADPIAADIEAAGGAFSGLKPQGKRAQKREQASGLADLGDVDAALSDLDKELSDLGM